MIMYTVCISDNIYIYIYITHSVSLISFAYIYTTEYTHDIIGRWMKFLSNCHLMLSHYSYYPPPLISSRDLRSCIFTIIAKLFRYLKRRYWTFGGGDSLTYALHTAYIGEYGEYLYSRYLKFLMTIGESIPKVAGYLYFLSSVGNVPHPQNGSQIISATNDMVGKGQQNYPPGSISHPRVVGKMSFLFHWWDMLVSIKNWHGTESQRTALL